MGEGMHNTWFRHDPTAYSRPHGHHRDRSNYQLETELAEIQGRQIGKSTYPGRNYVQDGQDVRAQSTKTTHRQCRHFKLHVQFAESPRASTCIALIHDSAPLQPPARIHGKPPNGDSPLRPVQIWCDNWPLPDIMPHIHSKMPTLHLSIRTSCESR